jgi:hypothetical protein
VVVEVVWKRRREGSGKEEVACPVFRVRTSSISRPRKSPSALRKKGKKGKSKKKKGEKERKMSAAAPEKALQRFCEDYAQFFEFSELNATQVPSFQQIIPCRCC